MKYKDLSEQEQEDFNSLTNVKHKPKAKKADIYGLCSSCKHFNLIKSEFKIIKATCECHSDVHITIEEPIKYCSLYTKIGEMTLYEMGQLALFIDIENEEGKVGF